jgi:DNA cross-link repair 1C protein
MSTFLGFIEEIPGISIDCFVEENLNSSIFFLSHCHYDHMKGLNFNFFYDLMKTNKFLYCSHLSKLLLRSTFNLDIELNKYIKILPLDDSIIINYLYDNIYHSLMVSSISSGHCLGSIMFLFKCNEQKILYTGDFRINIEDFSKLKSLHYMDNPHIPLSIDKIYLDTTFLNISYKVFPSRLTSLRELCTTIKNWIEKDPKNIILLEISALYGSEFIYIELSRILGQRIHVQQNAYKVYKHIEILQNCVTNVSETTSIHACMKKKDSLKNIFGIKCRSDIDNKHVLTIVLSAKKWIGKDTSCIIESDDIRKQTTNICYSTHASYNELKAFLEYFRPKQVFSCVYNHNNQKEIYKLLGTIIQNIKHNEVFNENRKLSFLKHKSFIEDLKPSIISDDEDDL